VREVCRGRKAPIGKKDAVASKVLLLDEKVYRSCLAVNESKIVLVVRRHPGNRMHDSKIKRASGQYQDPWRISKISIWLKCALTKFYLIEKSLRAFEIVGSGSDEYLARCFRSTYRGVSKSWGTISE
jgi:hypothetical protein